MCTPDGQYRLLFDEESRACVLEVEVVAELARTISASLDLDVVLQRIADGARRLCGSDLCTIALRDPGSCTLTLRYRSGAARCRGKGDRRFSPRSRLLSCLTRPSRLFWLNTAFQQLGRGTAGVMAA